MAVAGDGLARRKNLYERGLVPPEWPAIRETSGFDPAAPVSEEGAQHAIHELVDRGALFSGRYCWVCVADLSDVGAPRSSSREGFKAATGVYPDWTAAIPQGGHAPDCPVPYLLRWAGWPANSTVVRMRTHDIDDAQAQVLTKAKEPMELAGAQLDQLTAAEREQRAEVLKGLGLTEADLQK